MTETNWPYFCLNRSRKFAVCFLISENNGYTFENIPRFSEYMTTPIEYKIQDLQIRNSSGVAITHNCNRWKWEGGKFLKWNSWFVFQIHFYEIVYLMTSKMHLVAGWSSYMIVTNTNIKRRKERGFWIFR